MKGNNSPVVHRLYAGNNLRNFSYLIECNDACWVIDPFSADQIQKELERLAKPLVGIINTHEHFDHTCGNEKLVQKFSCPVYVHPGALAIVKEATHSLAPADIIDLGNSYQLEALDTPGHTFSHLCLLLKEHEQVRAAFTGDTLFNAGVGNCHNGGDPKILFQTIRDYFMTLPDEVVIYPGHDYLRNNLGFTLDREPGNSIAKDWLTRHQKIDHEREFWQTSMKDEKKINTFLRLDEKEIINNLPKPVKTAEEIFITLRELRNKW